MAQLVENHILMAAHQLLVFVFFGLEHTFEKPGTLLEEVFLGFTLSSLSV